jgi:hypothetical protein
LPIGGVEFPKRPEGCGVTEVRPETRISQNMGQGISGYMEETGCQENCRISPEISQSVVEMDIWKKGDLKIVF